MSYVMRVFWSGTMIDAYVIRVKSDNTADHAALKLKQTAPKNVNVIMFDAVEPKSVPKKLKYYGLRWNYPWESEAFDVPSGLVKKAYPTLIKEKRIACFLSHYILWKRCVKNDVPIVIHEHDAIYYADDELPLETFAKSRYNIIGLNTPDKATRLSNIYHNRVQESEEGDVVRAPSIDRPEIPQGIAGNSSYYMEPAGAKKMVDLVDQYECWPNDALMCRQLVPLLGQTKKYYTYMQGLESTTSR